MPLVRDATAAEQMICGDQWDMNRSVVCSGNGNVNVEGEGAGETDGKRQ